MLTEHFLTCGQPEPTAEMVPMRAGPLTMLFDPTNGFLRRIRFGDREVLRGIYAAVRDRDWGTVPGLVRDMTSDVAARAFRLQFECEHRQRDVHFVWRGTVRGDHDGTLRYEFDGEAKAPFLRNRIGFCVLHPIRECAGARARQTRTDGSIVEGRFPELIEPQIVGRSSFRDLRGVAHEIEEGLWAELEFEGDTFEMEDQRNWTDASFKTYCTPLARTFPVEVTPGTRIRQAVTLRCLGNRIPPEKPGHIPVRRSDPELIRLAIPTSPTARLPHVGLGVASHGAELIESELNELRRLEPSHLRIDLELATQTWPAKLRQAALEAEQLRARLELAIHLPRQGEVQNPAVAQVLERHAPLIARVLALRQGEAATSCPTLRQVRTLLGRSPVPVGAGSDCNFCELNREHALGHLALSEADFLFWAVNPQVHAVDHLSMVETLEGQTATVNSARAFAAGRPLVVTPVTMKQRFNPVATGPEPEPSAGELPSQVDARQLSLFGAAWTLGSLAALAVAGVESATFYETTGWRGVLETKAGSPLPRKFPSEPGKPFPLFQIFAAIAGFDRVAPVTSDSRLAALALFNATGGRRLLVANLTHTPRQIHLEGCGTGARIGLFDATSHPRGSLLAGTEGGFRARTGGARITLLAYGLACVDEP